MTHPDLHTPSRSTFPVEAAVWLGGLALLALLDPSADHFSVCLLKYTGLGFCPGCGLGRSISFLLHGDIFGSLRTHLLGIPATAVLLTRVFVLLRISFHDVQSPATTHHTKG